MMTMTSAEEAVVEKIARHYIRRTRNRDIDDLRQVAAEIVIKARPKWHPGVGVPLEAYLSRACYLGVGRYLYQTSCTVSVPINRAREALAEMKVLPTEDHETVPARGTASTGRRPIGVELMEEAFLDADWRYRAHAYIRSVVEPLPYGKAALAVLLDGATAREVASRIGASTDAVYRAVAEAKKALFTAQSRSLVRELKR